MNKNSLHNMGSRSVNTLETEGPRSLKVSLDRIYKMLVEARYKEDSYKDILTGKDFYMCH